ncbi:hypothetical protein DL95DRAFT_88950 [Leptodontidium sp. 2 PMI_412]|nr:hypothetical protein DL95DRAFT_88950 [Leptodontidium sp. 2 PMI_412]
MLFVSFENLRGYTGAALRHIDGGIRILSQLLPKKPSTPATDQDAYVPTSLLLKMFTRLDMASSQTVITLPLLLDGCQATPSFESASPSFEETNTMLSEILNTGFELVRISWMCPVGALYDELRQRHLQELHSLRAALGNLPREFQNFQNRQGTSMDPRILERVPVLKIIQIIIAVILDVEPAEAREYGERWCRTDTG